MKKLLVKKFIKKILFFVFRHSPLRKIIIFESNPDFSCNTYPVYCYLKNERPDYKYVWVSQNGNFKIDGIDDVIICKSKNFLERFKYYYYFMRSPAIICCNIPYPKYNERQVSIFLCHGSKTKKTRGIYEVGRDTDYVNVQSHFFDDVITYEYACEQSQLVYLGYPRCDYFYKGINSDINYRLLGKRSAKYMVWLPTFRKHNLGLTDAEDTPFNNIGMPLIYSVEMLREFNRFLQKLNLHVIFKPHPVQDISVIQKEVLSHIHIIFDGDLLEKNIQLYEVLSQSEALITDYSSVFFDYLLLDRPIATTTDDIESWKAGRGFAFDLDAMYDKATVRVPDIERLKEFVLDVLDGKDTHQGGRREIRDLTNMHQDGNSAARVGEFILKKIGEKA